MAIKEQTFLKPGKYHLGNGRYRTLTKADLKRFMDGTNKVLANNGHVPILSEHALPGEVGPQFSDKLPDQFADAIKTVGWTRKVSQNADGSLNVQMDITNNDYAKAIDEKSIKFSSPELRDNYTDGLGRDFGSVFSHFALTAKPRNPDQTPLKDAKALQFSLSQFMEGDEHKPDSDGDSLPDDVDTDPDDATPEFESDPTAQKRQQAARELYEALDGMGISVPTDAVTDLAGLPEGTLMGLLSAIKTKNRADEGNDPEKSLVSGENQIIEESLPPQFAETHPHLYERLKEAGRLQYNSTVKEIKERKIAPALIEELLSEPPQFSLNGTPEKKYTVAQFAEMVEKHYGKFFPQLSNDVKSPDHPDGDQFHNQNADTKPTGKAATEYADAFVSEMGMKPRNTLNYSDPDQVYMNPGPSKQPATTSRKSSSKSK